MLPQPADINQYLEKTAWPPLVPVQLDSSGPVIWCKLEFLNPSGSTKDRIARYIIGKALRTGSLHPGDMVVEASSGSTSIALAIVCAQRGLRFTAFMPEGVSSERLLIIQAYGGKTVFTPKAAGMAGAIAAADEAAKEHGAFFPRQFENMDNAAAHRFQTAQEIVSQIPGNNVDAVVSGVGTGGTLAGLYLGFRDFGCSVRPFLARPVDSAALADVECCSCFSGRVPGVMDGLSQIIRAVSMKGLTQIDVPADRALDTSRRLIRLGFPVGVSSGLNYQGALECARQLPPEATIVTVFPDRMERYFSTELFSQPR
jgi:cysteine synthase